VVTNIVGAVGIVVLLIALAVMSRHRPPNGERATRSG
jgi:hypothetical protein